MKDSLMNLESLKNKNIHFIGAGGIGMSGIAQFLAEKGFCVSGSDVAKNANIQRLEKLGVSLTIGHNPDTLKDKDLVVLSTDIKDENLEFKEAKAQGIPLIHRSELLALLMENYRGIAIAGTHGKTTTTGLLGWVMECAGLKPTVFNGGIMTAWGTNVKIGEGSWCISEADESDGSLINLPKEIALITNIDPEHMDHYTSLNDLHDTFERFATETTPGGFVVLGIDHPQVYALWTKIKNTHNCIPYGIHPEALVRAENIQITPTGTKFDLIQGSTRTPLVLSLYGAHNVLNALGVAAIASKCGIEVDVLQRAFASFEGVKRRFTCVGEWNGARIIDDYAHHPVEIEATLKAAKEVAKGRVIAVLEPHRYSRLANQFNEFATCCEQADITVVLPIYSAREAPLEGISHRSLAEAMKGDVHCCEEVKDLPSLIQKLMQPGDMIVCLGAGSISTLAHALPLELKKIYDKSVERKSC